MQSLLRVLWLAAGVAVGAAATALPQDITGHDPFTTTGPDGPSNKWLVGSQDTADPFDSPSEERLAKRFEIACGEGQADQACDVGVCTPAIQDVLAMLAGQLDGKGGSWPVPLVDAAADRYKRVNSTRFDSNNTIGCVAGWRVNQTGVREVASVRELYNGFAAIDICDLGCGQAVNSWGVWQLNYTQP